MEKTENRFLYLVKYIACMMVILGHTRFPEPLGVYADSLCKAAVPFFFAVSGRFFLHDSSAGTKEIRGRAGKNLKKIGLITLKVYLVYLVFSCFYHIRGGISFSEWLSSKFNPGEAKVFFLFNSGKFIYDGSYVYDHMWYLFAFIYVYILIWIFAPVFKKIIKPLTVLLFMELYFANLLQNYYPIRPFDISIKTWYVVRNWLLIGIPFVLLGVIFADYIEGLKSKLSKEEYEEKTSKWRVPFSVLIVFGILLGLLEVHIFGEKQCLVGSLLITIAILFLSETRLSGGSFFWKIGKKYSGIIYYYHVLVIAILDMMTNKGIIPPISGYLRPPVMMVIMTVIFGIIPLSKDMIYEKRRVS